MSQEIQIESLKIEKLSNILLMYNIKRLDHAWRRWRKCINRDYTFTQFDELKRIKNILAGTESTRRNAYQCGYMAHWLLRIEREIGNEKGYFHLIPLNVLKDFMKYGIYQAYDANELLFLQNEIGSYVYIILNGGIDVYDVNTSKINTSLYQEYYKEKLRLESSGQAKFPIYSKDHPSKILAAEVLKNKFLSSLKQGTSFGEIALMNNEPFRTATAITTQYTELIAIHKTSFNSTILPYFQVYYKFLDILNFLKSMDIFSEWTTSKLNHIAFWVEQINFPRGLVLTSDQFNKNFDIIYKGDILIQIYDNERSYDLCIRRSGNFLGEESLINYTVKRKYKLITLNNTTVLRLNSHFIKKLEVVSRGTNLYSKVKSIIEQRENFVEYKLRAIKKQNELAEDATFKKDISRITSHSLPKLEPYVVKTTIPTKSGYWMKTNVAPKNSYSGLNVFDVQKKQEENKTEFSFEEITSTVKKTFALKGIDSLFYQKKAINSKLLL